MRKLRFMSIILMLIVPSIVCAQSKPSKICVWADSEDPGVLMPKQPGGSVNSISGYEVHFIQQLIIDGLRADKTNNIVDPCPQTGENIEIDVVIGQFLGAYVASVSVVIAGGKDGHIRTGELADYDIYFDVLPSLVGMGPVLLVLSAL